MTMIMIRSQVNLKSNGAVAQSGRTQHLSNEQPQHNLTAFSSVNTETGAPRAPQPRLDASHEEELPSLQGTLLHAAETGLLCVV